MKPWDKQEIEIAGGAKVMAQVPVIVSASRSTDVPAFYSDWFIERLEAGYVKWFDRGGDCSYWRKVIENSEK